MKLSVVMSCYNSESYLRASIESILAQTFSDFEFIIWDDGSTDKTEEIIKSYKDPRIRYFYHNNTGLGMALQLACEQTRTDIIARMDADDIAYPERLKIEYEYLLKHSDVVLVSSAVRYMNDDGRVIGRSFPYSNNTVIKRLLAKGNNVIVHPSSMFRKKAYLDAGGYMPLKKAQDLHLFARMGKYGNFANISQPLLQYRLAESSISTQTAGSSYSRLINDYLFKMSNDEVVNEEDVDIFNRIVAESKRESKQKSITSEINSSRHKNTFEEQVYILVSRICGSTVSEHIIVGVKNIIGLIKY